MLRATLRGFVAHKGRLLLSLLAVVLSVAFVTGSLVFSDTVTRTFDGLFASTSADVTVAPKTEFDEGGRYGSGRTATLPASLQRRVAAVDGVAAAYADTTVRDVTVVNSRDQEVGPTTGAPTIASDWHPGERSPVRLTSGRPPRGAHEALIDADTADKRQLAIGDTLRVVAAPGTFPVRLVGIVTFTTTNPGAAMVFLDPATAPQQLLGKAGAATSVKADATPGVTDAVLKRRIAAALTSTGGAYELRTSAEQATSDAESFGRFLGVIKYVMLGFAGVAVLVGIFLIVNTFSMLIAQRTRELGLLRALGADRRQVRRSVLTEAVLLGLAGSTLGLAAGIGLAAGLVRLLGLLGMNLDAARLVVRWPTPVAAYAVGIGVTFVAAYLPSRRAAAVSPMAALSDTEVAGAGQPLRTRAAWGAAVGAAGVAALVGCALSGRTGTAAVLLGLGVALTLIATVVAGPLLVRPLVRVLGAAFPRVYGPVGLMSRRNALRNPRRTGATASALMVGLALVTGMAVAGSSMTKSFDEQVGKVLGADFVLQDSRFGSPFPQEITALVRGVAGVGTLVRQRTVPMKLALPDGRTVRTQGSAYDRGLDRVVHLTYTAGNTASALADDRIGMERSFAARHHVRVGSRIAVTFPEGRTARLTVGALSKPVSGNGVGPEGGITLGTATAQRYLPGGQDSALYVRAAPGADPQRLRTGLERALTPFPQIKVRDQADYKRLIHDQIAVLLYLVYALLGLAIVIAVLGVVNTLALAVIERTREIGLLRAIGLSRRQTRRMVRLESVVIAVFGAVLGLGLGLVWGVAMWRVLVLEGMKALAIPWSTVVTVVVGSVVVGLVAAVLPALRASRMNVLAAIAHE
ncbi:FtsX-like permease family protein [Streptomyces sp. NPDC005322]|uniref:FtsX-like permease family protein n=1 Tax=Streptomyces sp. NPDC005322 TaxID=3157032 RepID=UPI0033A4CB90